MEYISERRGWIYSLVVRCRFGVLRRLISAEDLASLEATVELLSDPAAMRRVREAQSDIEAGNFTTGEEMDLIMRNRGAPPRVAEGRYHLLLAPGARRALCDLLPEGAAMAAWELISGRLPMEPRRVGAQLRAPFDGHGSARRGEYRARYQIDEATHTVRILDIDHRRDIFRS